MREKVQIIYRQLGRLKANKQGGKQRIANLRKIRKLTNTDNGNDFMEICQDRENRKFMIITVLSQDIFRKKTKDVRVISDVSCLEVRTQRKHGLDRILLIEGVVVTD